MSNRSLAAQAHRPHSVARHCWFDPVTLGCLLICAALGLTIWAGLNRPASPPDYAGRVAGLAFSPFQRGQSPETRVFPSAAQIRADLQIAAGMTGRVRSYTVAGVFGDMPRLAAGLGLKLTLGAWLDRDRAGNAAELKRLAEVARGASNVERLLVGNEVLLRGDLTTPELIAAIGQVRQATHLPVSTAEPWHVWLKHPELVRAVDEITVHLLPYWEGLPEDKALAYTLERLAELQAAYPGKHIVIGEVGWPSDGVAIGAAHAGRIEQADFLRRFFATAGAGGLDYFVMEAFDQPWKTSFEGRAAGYWGMLDLDRQAKWAMSGPVLENPGWPLWAGGSVTIASLLAWGLLSRRADLRPAGKLLLAAMAQGFVAALAALLLAMSGKYLSGFAALVWGALALGQLVLLVLLLADGFELAEVLFGGRPRRAAVMRPASAAMDLPKVSLHLPICNEPPEMVRQTLDALAALEYGAFEVLVVDNNTTDPALWEPVAEHCARLGPRFRFFHLGKYPGYKAGALNFALANTAADAEIVGVLDSDYIVRPDWLRCAVPHFAHPQVGFVQSPQDYRDAGGGLFKRMMFWEYAGFFRLGMVTRNERNAIIQHGTMTLIRRAALAKAEPDGKGWAEWCICEDAALGLQLFRDGWQAVYSPQSFGRGVMPDDFAAFRKQRFRWAYGAMQICRHHAGALFSPFNRDLTLGQRWHFVTGWLPWVGDALGLAFLLMGLVWSAGLIAAPMRYEFPIVLFMLPSIGLFAFKLAQILVLYGARVPCSRGDRLGAALVGLALSHTIGKAVWKGLVVRGAPFLRTPKMRNAPALVQGLVMVREELAILLLTWAALVGVALRHHFATWEASLWCAVLATQSLPYLASVAVSLVAAVPARAAHLAPVLRLVPANDALPTELLAKTVAGD